MEDYVVYWEMEWWQFSCGWGTRNYHIDDDTDFQSKLHRSAMTKPYADLAIFFSHNVIEVQW